ncbi:hypothetical protein [Streptosporangium amethystogenes]|uniref:hypothetical protein n=1 Tax=Streptosporangium amethystogenes TaxID=2002 RepID=UPI0004C6A4A5|nr:hypothetical protein [Streptosporangium amethystogenes]
MLELRLQGLEVSDQILSHISPGHSDNINFFGVINVDVEAEPAKLDTGDWRPLRPAQLRELGLRPRVTLFHAPRRRRRRWWPPHGAGRHLTVRPV